MKTHSKIALAGILILLPLSLLAAPQEPELYDPVESINQGVDTYETMDKAKELTALLEARMEHLLELKIQDGVCGIKPLLNGL